MLVAREGTMRRRTSWTYAITMIAVVLALAWRAFGTGATPATVSAPANRPGIATSAPTPPGTGPAEPSTAPLDAATAPSVLRAVVSRNVDGDTIHVTMPDGGDEKIRLIGVNTPESTIRHEPYGKEASNYTKGRLPVGTVVWLETDVQLRDRYGRILAYVWLRPPRSASPAEVRANMFNAELLLKGFAQLMTIPPDVAYADVFRPMQSEAREAARGLWALPTGN